MVKPLNEKERRNVSGGLAQNGNRLIINPSTGLPDVSKELDSLKDFTKWYWSASLIENNLTKKLRIMRNFNEKAMTQEISVTEARNINGGIVISPIAGPFIPLEVLQKVFDAMTKE